MRSAVHPYFPYELITAFCSALTEVLWRATRSPFRPDIQFVVKIYPEYNRTMQKSKDTGYWVGTGNSLSIEFA